MQLRIRLPTTIRTILRIALITHSKYLELSRASPTSKVELVKTHKSNRLNTHSGWAGPRTGRSGASFKRDLYVSDADEDVTIPQTRRWLRRLAFAVVRHLLRAAAEDPARARRGAFRFGYPRPEAWY